MAYVITERCAGICDTACVTACPVECIHGPRPLAEIEAIPHEERALKLASIQLYIDPNECIDCNACVSECPVEAIFEEDDVPEASHASIEANATFFRARSAK